MIRRILRFITTLVINKAKRKLKLWDETICQTYAEQLQRERAITRIELHIESGEKLKRELTDRINGEK